MTLSVTLRERLGSFDLDVDFRAEGRVTALFGRSGAGKSTIVAFVAGLRRAGAGRVEVDGRTLFDAARGIDVPAHRRRVGVVFQEARLLPHLSVGRNLTYSRWAGGRRGAASLDAVVALLGIEALLGRAPANLSGGEAQRVAIGRALLSAPDILLMDEPLAHLDGARRAEILPYLDRLAHESGVPILYVSHAIDEVTRLAEGIVVLSEGRVVAAGPVEEVLGRLDLGPATGRHEAGSVLAARVAGHDAGYALTRLALGEDGPEMVVPAVPAPLGAPVRLRVRARDVALGTRRPKGLSIRNVLPARILEVAPEEGAFAEVLLDLAGQRLRARVTRASAAELGLKAGAEVYALVKSVAVERRALALVEGP